MRSVLACLLVLAAPLLCPSIARAETPLTLEEIDARLLVIEAELIKAQAERFRSKREVENTDTNASAKLVEAKTAEGSLITLRKELNERLLVLDETIRADQAKLDAQYKQRDENKLLSEAILREMESAKNVATNADERLLVQLGEELKQTEAQLQVIQAEIKDNQASLDQKKREVAARDEKAGKLQASLDQLQKEAHSKFGELHQMVDQSDSIKTLDQNRQALVQEFHQLREQKRKLVESKTTP